MKKAENPSVLVNVVRYVAEAVTIRRLETMVVTIMIHVGTNVVDLGMPVITNRIAEDPDAMMIRVQVLTIAMIVVDTDVIRRGKRGPIVG